MIASRVAEAVERLRAAAGNIILSSPEFNRLCGDNGNGRQPNRPVM
jgi:hypothetical protein